MMDIEETSICIVGGGPVGTLLSAILSRNYGIPNVVLERDTTIATDPRAFSLLENGVRCLQAVGLHDKVYTEIGNTRSSALFISGRHHDLNASPFFKLVFEDTSYSGHQQNLMFDQPTMEKYLRQIVKDSSLGHFREESEVIGIEEKDQRVEVTYKDVRTEAMHCLRARFVVGTDGKGGFTRKKYLEPKGILMEHTDPYETVYGGANLNVTTPTPESHPSFPLWRKGYSPAEVLESFVPEAFRFMCNPDRQCIMSRFGARRDGIVQWRHEFRTYPGEDADLLSQPEQVRRLLSPYMVHRGSRYGLSEDVAFPQDCLDFRRTWKYKFEARSCTKFHLGRVIVAGDAAHVFPPFGGQGVTTGFLDIMGLSWRLATLLKSENAEKDPGPVFDAWEAERRSQIKQALDVTMERGELFDEANTLKILWRDWMLWILQRTPIVKDRMHESGKVIPRYDYAEGMAFFPNSQGGIMFSQVYLRTADDTLMFSDDMIFAHGKQSLFQLVLLNDSLEQVREAMGELRCVRVAKQIIEEASYIVQDLGLQPAQLKIGCLRVARTASADEFNDSPLSKGRMPAVGYNPHVWRSQHAGRRYVVVRPDRFVFAACKDVMELAIALMSVERIMKCGII